MRLSVSELERSWRALILAGNDACSARDGRAAQRCAEASVVAERLFDLVPDDARACGLAPVAHAIAYRNLVSTALEAGRPDEARAVLIRAVGTLVSVIESPASPDTHRASCRRHLDQAVAFLLQIVPEAMQDPGAAALVRRARAAHHGTAGAWPSPEPERPGPHLR